MRVIRPAFPGAAEWQAQRVTVDAAHAVGAPIPDLEPAVVVGDSGEYPEGRGIPVEAVGAYGTVLSRRVVRDDVVEVAIQEAWRHLVQVAEGDI